LQSCGGGPSLATGGTWVFRKKGMIYVREDQTVDS